MAPDDYCFEKEPWRNMLPPQLIERFCLSGWADISFYLSDQWEFMSGVQKLAKATYSEDTA